MSQDLFGREIHDPEYVARARGLYQRWRVDSRYRLADGDARCCRTCVYLRTRQRMHLYHKCAVMGASGSSASDINLNHVCDHWADQEAACERIKRESDSA